MYNLFLEALDKVGLSTLIKELNVAPGTVQRWREKQEVPSDYYLDLNRLCGYEVDYGILSYREKGQFYTTKETATKCYNLFLETIEEYIPNIEEYTMLEPSAGNGAFSDLFEQDYIALDIEPRGKGIIQKDFFMWEPDINKKYLTIGNPPFGLRGQQALKFLNKALKHSEFCGFILPPLFDSDGRGAPKKRVQGRLLLTEPIENQYVYPDGKKVKVETIFQIWTSRSDLGEEVSSTEKPIGFQIYSLSDGGTASTTRNKDKIDKCNFYLPSTCFGVEKMKFYPSFEELPQRRGYGIIVTDNKLFNLISSIDLTKIAFSSTNGALNLRSSLIIKAINKKNKEEA